MTTTPTTIREALEARVQSLQATIAAAEAEVAEARAKLSATHPTLLALLDHPIEDVVAFIRRFGSELFPPKATTAAAPAQAEATGDTSGAAAQ